MSAFGEALGRWLRRAYRRGGDGACPDLELLLGVATGTAVSPRPKMEDHAATCPACRAEIRLALELLADRPGTAREEAAVERIVARLTGDDDVVPASPPAPVRPPAAQLWRWAAAAVVVLAVGVAAQWLHTRAPELPAPRPESALRGAYLEALAPVGDLTAPPAEFRFEASAGAAGGYRISLQRAGGQEVWYQAVDGSPAAVSPRLAARLEPAVVFHWWVEALDGEGDRTAVSERVSFRIIHR